MANFKVNTTRSKTLESLMGAEGPPPLADRQGQTPIGPLEAEMRDQVAAKRQAFQQTRDPAEVIGSNTKVTGTLPKLRTTTNNDARRL